MAPLGDAGRSPVRTPHKSKQNAAPVWGLRFPGAVTRIRTGDLILTKDALYLLSYNSKVHAPVRGHVATEKGLEPSTSSVTG